METTPPGKSAGREIVERTVEAALGSVPLVGNALAVTFVTAIGWRLEERREKWFTELAEGVEELSRRVDGELAGQFPTRDFWGALATPLPDPGREQSPDSITACLFPGIRRSLLCRPS